MKLQKTNLPCHQHLRRLQHHFINREKSQLCLKIPFDSHERNVIKTRTKACRGCSAQPGHHQSPVLTSHPGSVVWSLSLAQARATLLTLLTLLLLPISAGSCWGMHLLSICSGWSPGIKSNPPIPVLQMCCSPQGRWDSELCVDYQQINSELV